MQAIQGQRDYSGRFSLALVTWLAAAGLITPTVNSRIPESLK